MHIRLLTVGKLRQPHFAAACADYTKRLHAYSRVELAAVKPEPLKAGMSPAEERQALDAEGDRITAQLVPAHFNAALDSRGRQLTSRELAKRLNQLLITGKSNWTFVVGGPLGLSPAVKKQVELVLSLSQLTFPHELVPVLVLEQLYRAFKLIRGEPYHR